MQVDIREESEDEESDNEELDDDGESEESDDVHFSATDDIDSDVQQSAAKKARYKWNGLVLEIFESIQTVSAGSFINGLIPDELPKKSTSKNKKVYLKIETFLGFYLCPGLGFSTLGKVIRIRNCRPSS